MLALPIFPGPSARQVSWADASLTDLSRDGVHPDLPKIEKEDNLSAVLFVLALPIFPGRLQPSIVGRSELNFRVRDGNGWTLALISTNYLLYLHPENRTVKPLLRSQAACVFLINQIVGQALGLLVSVNYMHYCTSISDLSTSSSTTCLTPFG